MLRREKNRRAILVATSVLVVAVMLSGAGVVLAQQDTKAEGVQKKGGCCGSMMKECGQRMTQLKTALAAAKEAADGGDAKAASAKIAEAQKLLEQCEQMRAERMKKMMQMKKSGACKGGCKGVCTCGSGPKAAGKGQPASGASCPMSGKTCPITGKPIGQADQGVVNARCPMMGSKIDPKNVPDSLTRTFKGKKVGFCCAGCPVAWDKLSDADKQKKLDACTGAGAGK